MQWANTLVQGILLGGLYAVFATGLSLAFGVMRLVNLTHGDLSILAAFVAVTLVGATGVNPLATLAMLVPLMFGVGYVLQRGMLNRAVGPDPLPGLLITFGLSVIIQNLLLETYSADNRGLSVGALQTSSLRLTDGLAIGVFPLLTFLVGVGILAALQVFLSRTMLGRAFRAVSDDPGAARLIGIDDRHVFGLALGVSIATVALAGVLLGIRATFTPTIGPARLIFAFEAIIIGGLGSLWGTLAGGTILGSHRPWAHSCHPGGGCCRAISSSWGPGHTADGSVRQGSAGMSAWNETQTGARPAAGITPARCCLRSSSSLWPWFRSLVTRR